MNENVMLPKETTKVLVDLTGEVLTTDDLLRDLRAICDKSKIPINTSRAIR